MDEKNFLLMEIISTLFVAKLVEQKILNRTEIEDAFEALVDYQNELYGTDYEIILKESDCPLNLNTYLDSIRETGKLINELISFTTEKEDVDFLYQIKKNFVEELKFIKKSLENKNEQDL